MPHFPARRPALPGIPAGRRGTAPGPRPRVVAGRIPSPTEETAAQPAGFARSCGPLSIRNPPESAPGRSFKVCEGLFSNQVIPRRRGGREIPSLENPRTFPGAGMGGGGPRPARGAEKHGGNCHMGHVTIFCAPRSQDFAAKTTGVLLRGGVFLLAIRWYAMRLLYAMHFCYTPAIRQRMACSMAYSRVVSLFWKS